MSYFFTVQRVRFFILWPHIVNISRLYSDIFWVRYDTRTHAHTRERSSSSSASQAALAVTLQQRCLRGRSGLLALQKPAPGNGRTDPRYNHISQSLQTQHPLSFPHFPSRVNRYVLGFSRDARRQKESLDHSVRLERRVYPGRWSLFTVYCALLWSFLRCLPAKSIFIRYISLLERGFLHFYDVIQVWYLQRGCARCSGRLPIKNMRVRQLAHYTVNGRLLSCANWRTTLWKS